jgi:hypothetical protein
VPADEAESGRNLKGSSVPADDQDEEHLAHPDREIAALSMGLVRKSLSVGLTGGLVGYHSPNEKRIKKMAKNSKAQTKLQEQVAAAQIGAANAQLQYLRDQQRHAGERERLEMAAMSHQQQIVAMEAHQRWLAAQPVTCGYCRNISAAGAVRCGHCGSTDVASMQAGPAATPGPAEGWKDRVGRGNKL